MLILMVLYLQLQTVTFQEGQCEGLNCFPTCPEDFRVKLKQQTHCTEKSQEEKEFLAGILAAAKPLNASLHIWICKHMEQWSNRTAEDAFKMHILVPVGNFFLISLVGAPGTRKGHY